MKVLYVEDNVLDADLACREIHRQAPDIQVEVVPTLQEARTRLTPDAPYDVVLLDLRLPDGNGLTLLREIREQALPLAIVVLTSSGDEETAVAALKAGADDYLAKSHEYYARLPLILESALSRFRAEAARDARLLRVLYGEHNAADVDLTLRHMARQAPYIQFDVVTTMAEVLARLPATPLDPGRYDILLIDYRMPGSSALDLLKILRQERGLDLPIVLVTGQGDEEVAAHAWRLGVTDYLTKEPGYLYKLPVILENAFNRVRLAREQLALQESEARYRRLAENALDIIYRYRFLPSPGFEYVNPAAFTITGYTPDDHYADPQLGFKLVHPDDRHLLQQVATGNRISEPVVLRWIRKDGTIIWTEQHNVPVYDDNGNLIALEGIARDITVQKRAEELLRQSEEKYRKIVETAQEGIWIIDADAITTFVNARMAEMLGTTVDEMIGQPLFAFMEEDQIAAVRARLERRRQGVSERYELRLRRRDGTPLWTLVSASPLTNPDGSFCGAQAMITDITPLKQVQQAEQEQRRLADALRETAAALIRALDLDTVMSTILENVTRVVPNDASNIMLMEDSDQAYIAYLRGYQPETAAALRGIRFPIAGTLNLEHMLVTREPFLASYTDQYSGWVRVPATAWVKSYVAAPILSQDRVIGFLNLDSSTPGFFTPEHAQQLQAFADLASIAIEHAQLYEQIRRYATELEQRVIERTAELAQAKERIEAILNSSSDVIILCRTDGTISQANPSFEATFGCPADDALNQPFTALVIPEHRPLVETALAAVIRSRQPQRLEVTVQCLHGGTIETDTVFSPIVAREGDLPGIVCTLRDITLRKRMEARLRQMLEQAMQLSEMKTRYISMAAHDLRNPLAVIQSAFTILERYSDRLSEEKKREKYDVMRESIKRIVALLDDILTLGRVESGKLALTPAPTDVVALCKEIIAEISHTGNAPQTIDFSCRGTYRTPVLDAKFMWHILSNLLSNAIKYSPAESTITFTVDCQPQQVTFCIQDQGIGIPEDDQKQLFESFFRASNVGQIPGTGLGLAIVKQLVDLHNGSITFTSKTGVGTTFTVTIPQTVKENGSHGQDTGD